MKFETSAASSLHGKTAVITGAGRGLGACLALALAEQGCFPILAGRNSDSLRNVASRIKAEYGMDAAILGLDLADAQSVAMAVDSLRLEKREIDILVNNGAMWLEASDKDHSQVEVLTVLNAAVSGTFLFTQGLLPALQRSSRPDIVTIGSISGLPNAAIQTASIPFYAAKRAQAALAEGLAQMFCGLAVRSIAIHPPYLDDVDMGTTEWAEVLDRQKGARGTTRDIVEAVIFALTRPRHITLSITVDADEGGLHPARKG